MSTEPARSCEKCWFWQCTDPVRVDEDGNEFSLGICRRHAPKPLIQDAEASTADRMGDPYVVWAGTTSRDWCGEFQFNPHA